MVGGAHPTHSSAATGPGSGPVSEAQALPIRVLDSSLGMFELCARNDVNEIVVAMEDRRRDFPLRELLDCRLAGVDVTEILTFLERETGRVRLDVLNPSWLIFGPGFRRDSLRLFSSRALDVVASLLILALTLPIMLAVATAVLIEDGWRAPVLYRQTRVGRGGGGFELLHCQRLTHARADARPALVARDRREPGRGLAWLRAVHERAVRREEGLLRGVLSLGAIALYLVLAHYTGAEKTITATGKSTSEIFKTLQGR